MPFLVQNYSIMKGLWQKPKMVEIVITSQGCLVHPPCSTGTIRVVAEDHALVAFKYLQGQTPQHSWAACASSQSPPRWKGVSWFLGRECSIPICAHWLWSPLGRTFILFALSLQLFVYIGKNTLSLLFFRLSWILFLTTVLFRSTCYLSSHFFYSILLEPSSEPWYLTFEDFFEIWYQEEYWRATQSCEIEPGLKIQ